MENNNLNNQTVTTGVDAGVREVKTILFKPSVSIMLLTDMDLSKAVLANMQTRFKGVIGVSVIRTKNPNMPIKIKVTFLQTSDVFARTMNPQIARLLNSTDQYKVTEEARALLEPFITPRTPLDVEVTNNRKGGHVTLSIDLHPFKTLSACLKIEEGTAIRIGKIADTSKYNFIMEIENFPKQPVKPFQNNKNKNKDKDRDNRDRNNNYNRNRNYDNRR